MNKATCLMTATTFAVLATAGNNALAADSASAHKYSDKQLKEFVQAQNNVQAVLKKWEPKVAKAKDKDKAENNENKALGKAVKSAGLMPKQYNAIAQDAQKNPGLTKRIQSFMTPQ